MGNKKELPLILLTTKTLEYTFTKLLLIFSPVILHVPEILSVTIHLEHETLRSYLSCYFEITVMR